MDSVPDEMFRTLARPERRQLLLALTDQDSLTLPGDIPVDGEQKRLQIEYHHMHLPKLEKAGLVEWDRETDQVTRGPQFENVESVLHQLAESSEEMEISECLLPR